MLEANLRFSQDVHFRPPRDVRQPALVYDWKVGRYEIGDRRFIPQSITRSVENVVAVYVVANFGS